MGIRAFAGGGGGADVGEHRDRGDQCAAARKREALIRVPRTEQPLCVNVVAVGCAVGPAAAARRASVVRHADVRLSRSQRMPSTITTPRTASITTARVACRAYRSRRGSLCPNAYPNA